MTRALTLKNLRAMLSERGGYMLGNSLVMYSPQCLRFRNCDHYRYVDLHETAAERMAAIESAMDEVLGMVWCPFWCTACGGSYEQTIAHARGESPCSVFHGAAVWILAEVESRYSGWPDVGAMLVRMRNEEDFGDTAMLVLADAVQECGGEATAVKIKSWVAAGVGSI